MNTIESGSVDMIFCDLPFGTTQCKWDSVIPLPQLWKHYERIIKPNGAIVLNSAQPFTSVLIASNLKLFKYTWVWEKSKATGYLNAKKQPMRAHEDICIFYKNQPTYNPQMTEGEPYNKGKAHRPTDVYGSQRETLVESKDGLRYPRSVIYFKTAESEGEVIHPTQKPVALCEYMIRTYTNEGMLVLDNCTGSGSICLAAKNLNRQYIGIEQSEEFFKKAQKRLQNVFD
jgi:DNA modification methylase